MGFFQRISHKSLGVSGFIEACDFFFGKPLDKARYVLAGFFPDAFEISPNSRVEAQRMSLSFVFFGGPSQFFFACQNQPLVPDDQRQAYICHKTLKHANNVICTLVKTLFFHLMLTSHRYLLNMKKPTRICSPRGPATTLLGAMS